MLSELWSLGCKLYIEGGIPHRCVLAWYKSGLAVPHRLNLKVSYVFLLAAGAALSKAVAVQLCQLVPGDPRPQMQPVHVLADHPM